MGCCNSSATTIDNKATPIPQQSPDEVPKSSKHFVENVVIDNVGLDITDYYDIDDIVLGTGASGSVKICTHKTTQTQFALKTLNTRKVYGAKLQQLKDEIKMMSRLDHPNILRLREYFVTRDCIFLVLDLCRGGELLDRLHKQAGHHYSELVACKHIRTMLSAITYIHNHGIVHRDLKLENFLFVGEDEDSELVLIDFGLSHYFKPQEVLHSAVGTPYYVAPEVLDGNYDSKCDVWSIGVIAFMLLSGTPPFYGKTDAETLRSVQMGRYELRDNLFGTISMSGRNFITTCLQKLPKKRPTAAEALCHPWFDLAKSNVDIRMTSTQISTVETSDKSSKVLSLLPMDTVSRLRGFVSRPALAKVCMDVVAHTLRAEQIADLRQQFAKFDVRQTGEISIADVRTVLTEHGEFAEEDLEYIFTGVDLERSDTMSYHEFLAATISFKNITKQNLQVAFETMSHHQDYITRDDVQALLGTDSENLGEVEDMFVEMNLAPSAKINFEKFEEIMNGGVNKSPTIKSPMSMASPYRSNTRKKLFFSSALHSPMSSPSPSTKKMLSTGTAGSIPFADAKKEENNFHT